MQQAATIYDSERFVVVAYDSDETQYEIVDKTSCRLMYLCGDWALLFERHCDSWKKEPPEKDEVERVLAGFAALAQQPLCLH